MNLAIKKNQIIDILLLLLYSLSIVFASDPILNQLSLYVIIPIMGIIVFIINYKVYFSNKYIYLYLFLLLWMFITSLSAENTDQAFRQMTRMMSCYILAVISFYISSRNRNYVWLYVLFIIYFVILIYTTSKNEGFVIAQSANDREQFDTNANTYAYFLFYMSFALIMLLNIYKKGKIILGIIASIFIAILSIYLALVTASRQVLLIQIPFICLILLLIYFKPNPKNITLFILILAVVLIYGLPIFNEYYSNSFLSVRSEEALTEDSRFYLIVKGLEEGIKHPILGLGPNNFVLKYDAYTHCSYTELFACSGLPALFLYLAIIYRFITKNIGMYRKTKDKIFNLFVIFGLIFSLYNFLYVFVGNLWLMAFFYVILGHSENYYRKYYNK